jgi:hypothetical protein
MSAIPCILLSYTTYIRPPWDSYISQATQAQLMNQTDERKISEINVQKIESLCWFIERFSGWRSGHVIYLCSYSLLITPGAALTPLYLFPAELIHVYLQYHFPSIVCFSLWFPIFVYNPRKSGNIGWTGIAIEGLAYAYIHYPQAHKSPHDHYHSLVYVHNLIIF